MSYFDPYYLYNHPQRHSHKGQVIQKKPVKINYAATQEDLKRAIEVAKAYGYYVSKTLSPIQNTIYSGYVLSNEFKLSTILNSNIKSRLLRFNDEFFNFNPDSIQLSIVINYIYINNLTSENTCTLQMADGTNSVLSLGIAWNYVMPNASNSLLHISLNANPPTIARGTVQNWNNGVLFINLDEIQFYYKYKNNDYQLDDDEQYALVASEGNIIVGFGYTIYFSINS